MTDDKAAAIVAKFKRVWPDAAFGPAHIVIDDENFEACHLQWCNGIIYAVQQERTLGGRLLYPDHSDDEIEATRRLLQLLLTGSNEMQFDGAGVIQTHRWEDVPTGW